MITCKFEVFSKNPGNPVHRARVILKPQGKANLSPRETMTDENGEATIDIPEEDIPSYHLIVSATGHEIPYRASWNREECIILPPLKKAEKHLGWWHAALGVNKFDRKAGKGINIGVIDSGVCKHPDLTHVADCGIFVNGLYCDDCEGRDEIGHGCAVIGLIGALPPTSEMNAYGGLAPASEIFSVKAFDSAYERLTTGTQAEIKEAIYVLASQKKVDIINCSFSSDPKEGDEEDTEDIIKEAYDLGALCICAAGNEPGRAKFPARSALTVSVSAVGMQNTVGEGTLPETSLPHPRRPPNWHENYFLCTFSAREGKIDCCGFGVGLVAIAVTSDPEAREYQSVFGTSFATPLVCGVLAAALSTDETYKDLPRTSVRVEYALNKLKSLCKPLGSNLQWAGNGLPMLPTP